MPITCPKCHHTRSAQDDPLIPDYQCPACGVVYTKIQRNPLSGDVMNNIRRSRERPENLRPAVFVADEKPRDDHYRSRPTSFQSPSFEPKVVGVVSILILSGFMLSWVFTGYEQKAAAEKLEAETKAAQVRASEEMRIANAAIENQRQKDRENSRLAQIEQENARLRAELAKKQQQQAVEDDMFSTTAEEIAEIYMRNTLLGDNKYKGRRFSVTLIVDNINTDIFGNPYIVAKTPNRFLGPQFKFDKSYINQLINLSSGNRITITCIGHGDVAKTPMSRDCRI